MRKQALATAALLAVAALTLTACGGGADSSDKPPVTVVSEQPGSDKAAIVLDTPFEKPDLVLTDTNGKKYDFRKETAGKATLVYFGYTSCPDVCPTTMSNIAVAKKQLPKDQQDALRVVFITTDPVRDTSAALGKWLKGIDPQIVGLTGAFPTVQAAARTVGITIEPPYKDKNGRMVSTHGTQVIAFSPKSDDGYVVYTEDTLVDDYAKDLPKLLKGAKP
ncbi:secreted protein [Streptomyces zinciresistens K42]|uniref:Secreted protein n=1 Tax=Streptomyces zinciresistens K42 TaxID=700597 RepID=G2G6W5_9ACTN|nr:SCO family protein [Streptomyces zinciresistens]EGX60678.1 secreted protein [Streptomyces zinciresistens K42]